MNSFNKEAFRQQQKNVSKQEMQKLEDESPKIDDEDKNSEDVGTGSYVDSGNRESDASIQKYQTEFLTDPELTFMSKISKS